ncbi:MAG TPA: D-alanyl-D-alanine carboxypeptidase/D-alanyl-D-alanine-endopeptidase, partial [Solirubrobacterales bacterium]|nr:D-alanyl-D-alanine carboxypeptidase/D-alanyl-D-alanine-endopeptidase [Solirubrobacterales bacterium]
MRRPPAIAAVICALLAALFLAAAAEAAARSDVCTTMRSRLVRGGGGASGLLVIDGQTGKTVCARAPRRQRPLASNMKLFTTATALDRLGAQTRIATLLKTDGGIDRNGVLRGNLYLVGAGDPTLGTPSFYRRFLGGQGTNVFMLKRQAREAGIDSVTGRLYADDSIFDRLRGVADSGYATSPEIGPLSGLSFNSGYSTASGYSFASDPALTAAGTLNLALREAGVRISPTVALGSAPPFSTELARVESPPLTSIVNTTDVYSHNFFAEMLIKLIGARFGGAGTTASGARVVEAFARSHGSGVQAVDGSGLTRSNRASPAQVVALLRSMRDTDVGDEFIQDLAITGQEGTVADRMHGTAAYGRCRTKTGTIRAVSNLSGYCFNRSGRVMIFSILMAS